MLLVMITTFALAVACWLIPKGAVSEVLRWPVWYRRIRRYRGVSVQISRYQYGEHPRQYVLRIRGESPLSDARPQIIYFHGGGWMFGSPEMFRANAQSLVAEGYDVWMPSHRRLPFHDIYDLRQDLTLCMLRIWDILKQEVKTNCPMVMGGVSSGGHLAALLVLDSMLHSQVALPGLRGLFLIAAPLDFGKMWYSPLLRFLAGSRNSVKYRCANPISFVSEAKEIPTLIIHGTKDGLVNIESTRSFYAALTAKRWSQVWLAELPGCTHLDAAGWCYRQHPAHTPLMDWLKDITTTQEVYPQER